MRVDKFVMQRLNRRNVLNCIHKNGPINQAAIAEMVDLSIPSVMKIVDGLYENGLVRKSGKGKSTGGKRPELLDFVPDVRYTIGIDVGRVHLRAIVSDLAGNIIYRKAEPTGDTLPVQNLVNRIADMIKEAITSSDIDEERLLGIGVGMPGLIETLTGRVLFSPDFGWKDILLKDELQNLLQRKVYVENANLSLARGEYNYGSGIGADCIICVSVGSGIGAGIIFNGKPYHGKSGTSGEIGHITMEREGPLCMCGNHGCLEALASGEAIAQKARKLAIDNKASYLFEMANRDVDTIDAKMVFTAAQNGDSVSLDIVDRATEYIGIALADYANLMDPDRIIICGGLARSGAFFIDRVKETMKERQMQMAGTSVRVCVGSLDEYAVALGATCQIIEPFFEMGGSVSDLQEFLHECETEEKRT